MFSNLTGAAYQQVFQIKMQKMTVLITQQFQVASINKAAPEEKEDDAEESDNSLPKLVHLSALNNGFGERTYDDDPPDLTLPGKVNLNPRHQGKPGTKDIIFN